jgi:GMP synthase (glutamine-hydrolysing)
MTEVGHWHNDMPGLTPNAKIIAFSAGCPRQIIEYSKLVYGLQCHMELTSEVVELLIQHSEVELNDAHNYNWELSLACRYANGQLRSFFLSEKT